MPNHRVSAKIPQPTRHDPNFLFEDGGVTALNNPALKLFQMATERAYNLNWAKGEDKLLLVSVGTGLAYQTGYKMGRKGQSLLKSAKNIPGELMREIALENDTVCRVLGRCTFGHFLNREIKELVVPNDLPNQGREFTYVRYETDLEPTLKEMARADLDATKLQMDDVDSIPLFADIGKTSCRQVDVKAHFRDFV